MKMQQLISDTFYLGQTLNPVYDSQKVKAFDYGLDFKDIVDKINQLEILMKKGRTIPIL